MHDGKSLYCGNYVSDVFDAEIGLWWHCEDYNIIEISHFTEVIYTRDSHTKNDKK